MKLRYLLALAWVAAFFLVPALSQPASAQTIKQNLCGGADLSVQKTEAKCSNKDLNGDGEITESEKNGTYAESRINKIIKTVITILTVVIGIIAVIMIMVGGFKYVTSGGDSGKVTSAKNTIIYAIIGLIIVAFAQFLARFILAKVTE